MEKKYLYILFGLISAIVLSSCQKVLEPNGGTQVFRPSQLVGTWSGSKNPNILIINTDKDAFQYGDLSSIDMPEGFSENKNTDVEEYVLSFQYAMRDDSGSIPVIKTYNVKVTFKDDYECTVEDDRYSKDTFKRASRDQNVTFAVNSLGNNRWRNKDDLSDEFSISSEGGIYYRSLIDHKIPDYNDRRVEELSVETSVGTFKFITGSRCEFNNKIYIKNYQM